MASFYLIIKAAKHTRNPGCHSVLPCQLAQRLALQNDLPQGVLADVDLLNTINEAARNCVRKFVEDRTDKDGRVSVNALAGLARMTGFGVEPWVAALKVGAQHCHRHSPELGGTKPASERVTWLPLAAGRLQNGMTCRLAVKPAAWSVLLSTAQSCPSKWTLFMSFILQ